MNAAARPSYLRANGGQVSMLTGQNGQATQTVTGAIPSTSYTVTAWCYVGAGTATLSVGSGGVAGTVTAAGSWQQITASGSSDASGNLAISLSSSNTSGANVDWDDVMVSAIEPANPVATWAQTFGYDGFGNLLSETPTAGSAPNLNVNVDTATNRVVASGVQYDAAGNMINDGTQAYTFDEANRLKTAGARYYTYSGLENKRVIAYDNTHPAAPGATINLYGPDGKRLGYYTFAGANSGWGTVTPGAFQNFLYLGNKALTYTEDRIGSAGNYYPYGNGYVASGAEAQNFGTYVQDESGLLYADQRYYTAGFGRFLTADRSNANIDYGNPVSWNRYAYTNGDPVNGMDPTGNCAATYSGICDSWCPASEASCGQYTGDPNYINPTPSMGPPTPTELNDAYNRYAQQQQTLFLTNFLQWYFDPVRIALLQGAQQAAIKDALDARLTSLGVPYTQIQSILAALLPGLDVGGHANLTVSVDALKSALQGDTNDILGALVTGLFGSDGSVLGGNRGSIGSLFDSLHSEYVPTGDPNIPPSQLQFHIDVFNAFGFPPIGLIGHFITDVGFGHLIGGPPACIDPPCFP